MTFSPVRALLQLTKQKLQDQLKPIEEALLNWLIFHANVINQVVENASDSVNLEKEERATILERLVVKIKESAKTNEDLTKQFNHLKLSIEGITKITAEPQRIKRCRYFNRGYCRYGSQCNYRHSSTICEEHATCKRRDCPHKHPWHCRHWMTKLEGCKWGGKLSVSAFGK